MCGFSCVSPVCLHLFDVGSSCDNSGMQLEMVSTGLRVGIKRPSDELREDVRPSKEPMLVLTSDSLNNSSHHSVGTGAASSGLGLALGLSGCAPVAASSVAPSSSSSSNVVVGSSSGNGNGGGAAGGGVLHQLLGPVSSAAPPTHVASSAVGASGGGVGVVATAAGGGAVGAAGGGFPPASSGTSGSGGGGSNSKLYEKNKMLASLLAKTPIQSSLPTSIASPKPSALPQEKLPKDLKVGLRGLEPLFNIHAATVNAAESSQSSLLVIPVFYFFLFSLSLSSPSFIFFSSPSLRFFLGCSVSRRQWLALAARRLSTLYLCLLHGSFSIFFFLNFIWFANLFLS